MITGKTRLCGIVGHPIGHVRVPMAFNERFAARGIDCVSLPFHVRPENFAAWVQGMRAQDNLDGFVVTAPHKKAMVALCDEVVGEAKLVGAVNTVRREPDGRLVGELFDGRGFVNGLLAHGHAVAGKRVFVMGAGGAGNAVTFALARAGVAALTVCNRTPARAEDLVRRLAAAYPQCEVRVGARDARGHDAAVNTTTLGLEAGDELPFAVEGLPPMLVAEVIMKPERTALVNTAAACGHATQEGRHMLDFQADLICDFLRIGDAPAKNG
ncbi:MAG: shikimate dehydrogenase [Comamonadaceae bacterium]|nr:MAG: shikimate dehydrogenase [Comamonadaceae bacterium]